MKEACFAVFFWIVAMILITIVLGFGKICDEIVLIRESICKIHQYHPPHDP